MTAGALEGKVAIVTGAAMGMGEATARLFAAAGATVLVADVNPEVGQATAERIEQEGGAASFCRVDVSRAADVQAMVQTAVCPGAIDTPMIRGALKTVGLTEAEFAPVLSLFGRFGRPEEVGQASLWLCSDAASYVTGAILNVDAGYTSR